MPVDASGHNLDIVSYFSLEEYLDRIKLSGKLLSHLEYTNEEFDKYIRFLSRYSEEALAEYLSYVVYQELKTNHSVENAVFNEKQQKDKGIFFTTLTINHKEIHNLHNYVLGSEQNTTYEPSFSYRTVPVRISSLKTDGSEEIFWRGANPEDVNKFMSDFIKVYKQSKLNFLYTSPFLNGAIMSLLFNRIHPYNDGNGRTSRIIYNLKFTEQLNKQYGTKLMLNPLNITNRILVNKPTYVRTINQIPFNLTDDANESINNWFDFILTMADEQLFFVENYLHLEAKKEEPVNEQEIIKGIRKSRILKIK